MWSCNKFEYICLINLNTFGFQFPRSWLLSQINPINDIICSIQNVFCVNRVSLIGQGCLIELLALLANGILKALGTAVITICIVETHRTYLFV